MSHLQASETFIRCQLNRHINLIVIWWWETGIYASPKCFVPLFFKVLPSVFVHKCCHAGVFLTITVAVGQSRQAAHSLRAAKMWSARGMRQSSPAQPWAASQLPPSDGWKGRKNWQVSRITASLCLFHMLYVCPLPLQVLVSGGSSSVSKM